MGKNKVKGKCCLYWNASIWWNKWVIQASIEPRCPSSLLHHVRLHVLVCNDEIMLLFFYSTGQPEASRAELMVMTVSEIIKELISAHEKGENVNLNK